MKQESKFENSALLQISPFEKNFLDIFFYDINLKPYERQVDYKIQFEKENASENQILVVSKYISKYFPRFTGHSVFGVVHSKGRYTMLRGLCLVHKNSYKIPDKTLCADKPKDT